MIFVALGGFLGANSRYIVSKYVDQKTKSKFPFGTIMVNVLGSFALGLLYSLNLSTNQMLLLGTGFMGSFTTFSTFKVETLKLGLMEEYRVMSRYLIYSYGLGFTFAFIGFIIGNIIK